ncbi:MAG: hypothetical protein J5917_06075 [Bacteroidales bacterium]|nr:hypothetical protein [Bacteroidales bacterium]
MCFRVKSGLAISSVSVNGVYRQGTLMLSALSAGWTPSGQADGSYTLTSPTLKADTSKDGYDIVDDEYTLLLLPQTLPSSAKILSEGNNPFYSWGRKDPVAASDGINNSKVVYPKAAFSDLNASNFLWGTDASRNYPGRTYGNLFFPASGDRPSGYNQTLQYVQTSGLYWTSTTGDQNQFIRALSLSFNSSSITGVDSSYSPLSCISAVSVRPVKE